MTAEDSNNLYQIKQLSDSILSLVCGSDKNSQSDDIKYSEENLEAIATLEKQRQDLIQVFFSHSVAPTDSEEVANIIKQVLEINDKVTKELELNKLQLSKQIIQFKASKKATSAYLKNSL